MLSNILISFIFKMWSNISKSSSYWRRVGKWYCF